MKDDGVELGSSKDPTSTMMTTSDQEYHQMEENSVVLVANSLSYCFKRRFRLQFMDVQANDARIKSLIIAW